MAGSTTTLLATAAWRHATTSWKTTAIEGYLKPREVGFVFRDGRFAGKTIEEAAADPRGKDYIAWAAAEHKRPMVREACQKFLLTADTVVH